MSNQQRRIAPHVTRRQLVQGAAAASLAGPAVLVASASDAAEPSLEPFTLTQPAFSRAERDRRWAAVRTGMARPAWALDAIVCVGSDKAGDYARYLTQIGNRRAGSDSSGPEVIFTRDPAQPVYVQLGAERNRAIWSERIADWIGDGKLVISDKSGAKGLLPEFKTRGLDRAGARIGIAHLNGSRFDQEGLVSSGHLQALQTALPGAKFLPIDQWGTEAGPVEDSAMIKGPEEQALSRRAVAATEHGLDALVAAIRGGAKRQADAWFATYTAMFARTGEDPNRLSIALDQPGNSTLGEPVGDPLREGQIILEELEATISGYRAQINHSIFVGGPQTPGYGYYRAAFQINAGLIEDTIKFIQPGKTTCGDVVRRYQERVEAAGAEDTSGVMLHSGGIGSLSRPRVGPANSVEDFPIVLRPGMCFDLKPSIRLKRDRMADVGARNRNVQLGEHLLVTETGVQRLGSRPLTPLTTAG